MACQLCGSTHDLGPFRVLPREVMIQTCGICREQLHTHLVPAHWACLEESMWSPEAEVQVVAFRVLTRLDSDWSRGLLEQLWLEDEVRAWATSEALDPDDEPVVDSNGTRLVDGDSVTLIQDLKVKGGGFTAKQGTLVKGIRLGADATHVEGKVNKQAIMLKTCFLKKVG